MGYCFRLISKDKDFTQDGYGKAFDMLSPFNRRGDNKLRESPVCDMKMDNPRCITISGQHAEGFVLNMLINLIELGYMPKVLSRDWEYGSDDDWKFYESIF